MVDVVGSEQYDFINTQRLHPIIYTIITNKVATLKEIRDDYTIEEVLDLYELIMVNSYNRMQSMKEVNKNG